MTTVPTLHRVMRFDFIVKAFKIVPGLCYSLCAFYIYYTGQITGRFTLFLLSFCINGNSMGKNTYPATQGPFDQKMLMARIQL
jgi:hypothetical protein